MEQYVCNQWIREFLSQASVQQFFHRRGKLFCTNYGDTARCNMEGIINTDQTLDKPFQLDQAHDLLLLTCLLNSN
jgi:hypothetical protein